MENVSQIESEKVFINELLTEVLGPDTILQNEETILEQSMGNIINYISFIF